MMEAPSTSPDRWDKRGSAMIFFRTLSFISAAALLVKVRTRRLFKEAPLLGSSSWSFTRRNTRSVRTAVFPLPAPAATRKLPSPALMASSWEAVHLASLIGLVLLFFLSGVKMDHGFLGTIANVAIRAILAGVDLGVELLRGDGDIAGTDVGV